MNAIELGQEKDIIIKEKYDLDYPDDCESQDNNKMFSYLCENLPKDNSYINAKIVNRTTLEEIILAFDEKLKDCIIEDMNIKYIAYNTTLTPEDIFINGVEIIEKIDSN
jgi:hypothetical protein